MTSPRSTEQLENRLAFETLISDTSAALFAAPPDRITDAVQHALERVRTFFGADSCALLSVGPGQQSVRARSGSGAEGAELTDSGGVRIPIETRAAVPHLISLSAVNRDGVRPDVPGTRLGVLGALLVDALERQRTYTTQETLRLSEARLASGADLAGLAFYEVDFGPDVMYVDDRLRELCGIPRDREEGVQPLAFWLEHLHPGDRAHVLDVRERLQDGRLDRVAVEYRYLHPVRGEVWFQHLAGVAARDAAGRALRTYGVLRDITARKEAEQALRRSYEEIQQLKDRLQAESDYLKAEIGVTQARGEITGQSTAIGKVMRLVEQVAPTHSSVLVCGETGTGKERVAEAIHRLSPRRNRVMVKVNCAALPSGLVESELFGREKGAFTGALTRQIGRFELADGSTLFLDEIGELSLDLQGKLLRVLESGEFERLGSPRTIKVDVRLIAATNRDLVEAIRQGRFREDLYYRLNVFPLRVPPLRERPEDIPLLVWTFLEEFSSRMGKKITQVPRKTMEGLQRRAWPGNVRELRNVIEHGAIITEGSTLRVPLLEEAAPAAPRTLAEAERDYILRALERARWHVKGPRGAAAALGLNPATLYSRMKKLLIAPRRRAESAEGRDVDLGTSHRPRPTAPTGRMAVRAGSPHPEESMS